MRRPKNVGLVRVFACSKLYAYLSLYFNPQSVHGVCVCEVCPVGIDIGDNKIMNRFVSRHVIIVVITWNEYRWLQH